MVIKSNVQFESSIFTKHEIIIIFFFTESPVGKAYQWETLLPIVPKSLIQQQDMPILSPSINSTENDSSMENQHFAVIGDTRNGINIRKVIQIENNGDSNHIA